MIWIIVWPLLDSRIENGLPTELGFGAEDFVSAYGLDTALSSKIATFIKIQSSSRTIELNQARLHILISTNFTFNLTEIKGVFVRKYIRHAR